MSFDLKLNRLHDLELSNDKDAILIDGIQRIGQQVKVTLLTFLGEWFLDETWGIPYLEKILIKSPSRAEIENIIRAKVRAVPGVTAVPRVQVGIDAQGRQGRISLPDIQTIEGPVSVTVTR